MPDPSSEQPSEHPSEGSSGRPPFAETLRGKLEEYDVERHLGDLAGTLEHAVRQGVASVGQLAHEHQGDLRRLFGKAADAVDRRTEGRHADTINQVRGSLERGVEKIADHRSAATTEEPPSPDVPPATPGDG